MLRNLSSRRKMAEQQWPALRCDYDGGSFKARFANPPRGRWTLEVHAASWTSATTLCVEGEEQVLFLPGLQPALVQVRAGAEGRGWTEWATLDSLLGGRSYADGTAYQSFAYDVTPACAAFASAPVTSAAAVAAPSTPRPITSLGRYPRNVSAPFALEERAGELKHPRPATADSDGRTAGNLRRHGSDRLSDSLLRIEPPEVVDEGGEGLCASASSLLSCSDMVLRGESLTRAERWVPKLSRSSSAVCAHSTQRSGQRSPGRARRPFVYERSPRVRDLELDQRPSGPTVAAAAAISDSNTRLHADQQGWRGPREEQASRDYSLRRWVADVRPLSRGASSRPSSRPSSRAGRAPGAEAEAGTRAGEEAGGDETAGATAANGREADVVRGMWTW